MLLFPFVPPFRACVYILFSFLSLISFLFVLLHRHPLCPKKLRPLLRIDEGKSGCKLLMWKILIIKKVASLVYLEIPWNFWHISIILTLVFHAFSIFLSLYPFFYLPLPLLFPIPFCLLLSFPVSMYFPYIHWLILTIRLETLNLWSHINALSYPTWRSARVQLQ